MWLLYNTKNSDFWTPFSFTWDNNRVRFSNNQNLIFFYFNVNSFILTWLVFDPQSLWTSHTGHSIGHCLLQGKLTEVSRATHLHNHSEHLGESCRASWEKGRHHKQPPPSILITLVTIWSKFSLYNVVRKSQQHVTFLPDTVSVSAICCMGMLLFLNL